ncbi:MAG: alanine--tRNA ligase, partial [Muribaculaceae bacterium]|nr:alanine--tRNA ligase [Muribaculaceae bacterium]
VTNLAKQRIEQSTTINGIKVVTMQGVRLPEVVKNVAFKVRALSPENTAFIAATTDAANKPLLSVMLTDDVVASGHNASTMVRNAAKAIKGGGGGQPGFAQAGGKDAEAIAQAFQMLMDQI